MSYLLNNLPTIFNLLLEHIGLAVTALAVSILIALPLGWLLHRYPRLAGPVMAVLGTLYTIPSIAMIILLIPFLGLNARSVIAALILYCQVILVRNVLAGLEGIPPAVTEAARGMGMNDLQLALRVQLPLALPIILAGLRIAVVVAVAIATIGAKFGAGGLGTLLFDGIAQAGRMDKIWIGAVSVGLLSLAMNRALLSVERKFAFPA